jgi:hypothetical protein
MQKILEGAFLPFRSGTAFNESMDEWRDRELEKLEKKYTNERGLVDGKAILREIEAAERLRRRPIGIAGNYGNTGKAGIGHSRGNPG